ncbi:protein FAM53A-like [Dendronephthya gigantea]|uniref:protein FAM53A-like n=1 Tax=Dendronephthya gigantea TaxID=151771 RepID=UPI00106B6DF6|nr:protein FAM53A-like [Dendronephthya gigantea]XP_028391073.1 protein FAM53A-like [Dendronephthya gigantea]XP_028391074.1 protein FAM53A-like [Dendronephthya gigantea]
MVTLITEKLQDQTLEEISTTETILGEQPRRSLRDRSSIDTVRRASRLQHRRTSRTTASDASSTQDGSKLRELTSSFLTTRCHSYPPAKKRLCRSLSDPYKEYEGNANWIPEPSSIWTPVKPKRTERVKSSGARSLDFCSKDTFTWSTPPESPIPRPVSANSTLEDSKFFPLRFISEEKDGIQIDTVANVGQSDECGNLQSETVPRRSQSHPSFSHISNCGLKRRLSEIDIPRPALDFDKMKAMSFSNKIVDKRSLKSPKYLRKRNLPASPKHLCLPNQEKTMLMPTDTEDLGSSLLITPSASPTTDVKPFEDFKVGLKTENDDENANRKPFTDYFNAGSIMADVELDIKLIEEDGSLNHSTHNTMFFT